MPSFYPYCVAPIVLCFFSLLLARTAHVGIDGQTEGREGRAATAHGHGPAAAREDAASEAAGRDAVGQIVLGAEALDTALNAAEHGAHLAKVFGHAPRPLAHVFEADGELPPPRHLSDGLAHRSRRARRAGCVVGGIVGHLYVARFRWLVAAEGRNGVMGREGDIQMP